MGPHEGEGQLVVLTSSPGAECKISKREITRSDARASPLSGIPIEWIISPVLGYPRGVDIKPY